MDGINGRATIDFRNIGDLVAIEVGNSPSAVVAQHLVESSRNERNANEVERSALEEQLEHAESEQVDAMHDEADAVRAAGLARGAGLIAAGALGVASAVSGGDGSVSGRALAGGAKGAEGTGILLESVFSGRGKDLAADATSHGNAAQHLERRLKEIGEREAEARAQEQKALDGAAQAVETQARVEQATLFLRA